MGRTAQVHPGSAGKGDVIGHGEDGGSVTAGAPTSHTHSGKALACLLASSFPCKAPQPEESPVRQLWAWPPLLSVTHPRRPPPGRQVVPLLVTLFQMQRLGWILKAGGGPHWLGETDCVAGRSQHFLLTCPSHPVGAARGRFCSSPTVCLLLRCRDVRFKPLDSRVRSG